MALISSSTAVLIKEGVARGVVAKATEAMLKVIQKHKFQLIVTKEDLESALNTHIIYAYNWSKNIKFKELLKAKNTNSLYIDLDVQLSAKSNKAKKSPVEESYTIYEIINQCDSQIVMLGDPGAGKTTTTKNLCQKLICEDLPELSNYKFPILIELRDLKEKEGIYKRLKSILGINLFFGTDESLDKQKISLKAEQEVLERIVNNYLNELNALILIDGLDEISPKIYSEITSEIKTLFLNLTNSKVVLTCRGASYNIQLENSNVYELCPLTDGQITYFVNKWFTSSSEVNDFFQKLNSSTFKEVSIRPLLLAHLCALYEKTQKIPEKPKTVYKKLVNLLLEEWDEERGIIRETNYNNFETERKFEFLCHFAYELTISFDSKVYSEDEIEEVFLRIAATFDLPKRETKKVIKEIESHNGIIIKSSYDSFEFAHKSMQEYLAAEYIVKMPSIPKKLIYDINIANELAIAACLSSEANHYFYNLIFESFKGKALTTKFIVEFLKRLYSEKPDFKVSPLLTISFYYIYHLYADLKITDNIEKNSQPFSAQYLEIINDFIKIPIVKKSFYILNQNIDTKKKHFYEKDTFVLTLKHDILSYLEENDEIGYFDIDTELIVQKQLLF
jgi:predicted NACHT family NTPase